MNGYAFELRRIGLLVLLALAGVVPGPVRAQILGTAHDFSDQQWSSGEVCDVFHTSHNANTAVPDAPLWNHTLTNATFTVYSSPTMDRTPESPRGPSRLCLSCHDGTVASDSYAGNTGSNFVSGEALIGTGLMDDHPVSVYWDHQTDVKSCTGCHDVHVPTFTGELPFSQRYVECSTCHDVHGGTPEEKLLRMTLSGSQLCLYCHQK